MRLVRRALLVATFVAAAAVAAAWAISLRRWDSFNYSRVDKGSVATRNPVWNITSSAGRIRLAYSHWTEPADRRAEGLPKGMIVRFSFIEPPGFQWERFPRPDCPSLWAQRDHYVRSWKITPPAPEPLWHRFGFEGPTEGIIHPGYSLRAYRTIMLPYWLLQVVTLIFPAVWLMRVHVRRRRARLRAADLCAACGYDLRATPDRCPECGAIPYAGVTAAAAPPWGARA